MNIIKPSLFFGVKFSLKDFYEKKSITDTLRKVEGYVIYKLTNKVTGHIYIGDTSNLYIRFFTFWTGSHFDRYEDKSDGMRSSYKYNSMRKHGLDKFTIEILPPINGIEYNVMEDEGEYIKRFNCRYPDGYNVSLSGKGVGNGWQSIIGTIYITKDNRKYKRIHPNELPYYESLGFYKKHTSENTKWMKSPEGSYYQIHPNETGVFELLDYVYEHPFTDTVHMKSPTGRYTMVNKSEVNNFKLKGYVFEHNQNGMKWYKDSKGKEKDIRCIPGEEPEGYIKGRSKYYLNSGEGNYNKSYSKFSKHIINTLNLLSGLNLEVNEYNYNLLRYSHASSPMYMKALLKYPQLFPNQE
jgi:hypothetical protein